MEKQDPIKNLGRIAQDFSNQMGGVVAEILRGEGLPRDLNLAQKLIEILKEVQGVSDKLKRLSPMGEKNLNKPKFTNNQVLYPRFKFENDILTKIGLKRGGYNEEYFHSANRQDLEKIVNKLKNQISPLDTKKFIEETDREKIPSYKIYLVLNALNKLGELKNERKGVYTAIRNNNFYYLEIGKIIEKLKNI